MEVDRNKIEKYLDIVIRESVNVTKFSIKDILIENKHVGYDSPKDRNEFITIATSVLTLGKTYEYFEVLGHGWFKLTEIGLTAKEMGGHFKYQKSLKKKLMTTFELISAIFLVLTFGYTAFQDYQKSLLEEKVENLELKIDSLNINYLKQKDLYLNLKIKLEDLSTKLNKKPEK